MSARPAAPGLAQTLGLIIEGLRQAVARRSASHHAMAPLLVVVWGRLGRLAARFAALAARVRAEPLPPSRRRSPRKRPPPGQPRQRLPKGYAWLIRLVPQTPQFAAQVQHLLRDPDMLELLKTAPQAGRMLRPLCRMLAIRPVPPALRLPPRAAEPRATEPRATEPRAAEPRAAEPELPRRRPRRQSPPREAPDPQDPPTPPLAWRRWRGVLMPDSLRRVRPA